MQFRKRSRQPVRALRPRRGIALFISMFFVAGVGALALSAIYLTANASLLSKSYEKEDELKYASEAALAIGKSSLNFNPAALPNTSFVAMMVNKPVMAADGTPIPNVNVSLWVGPTGSTSGQFGRFASLVAQAKDAGGSGFVRRLELSQESFAKYAYWSNEETNNGSPIVFGSNDQLWGPVWSNDDITVGSTGATFHDVVGTAGIISGANYGTFSKGYSIKQKKIDLPALSTLSTLSGLAAAGGMSFTAPNKGNETNVLRRIEFLAADLNGAPDSTADNDGFFRVYTVPSGQTAWLRGDWPGGSSSTSLPTPAQVETCGDWHKVKYPAGFDAALPGGDAVAVWRFFPAAVHPQAWFSGHLVTYGGYNTTDANTEKGKDVKNIMIATQAGSPAPRCFLGGDPHLVSIARSGVAGYTTNQVQRGGDPTTFTPKDSKGGEWLQATSTPLAVIAAKRPFDKNYLYPLYRGYNNSTKGVIFVDGTVGVSGVIRSALTLYSPNTVVILDDLRYANDPAKGVCIDILGIIAGANVIVADNGLNSPVWLQGTAPKHKSLDDSQDLHIHAVIMALGTSFQVQNYDKDPTSAIGCQGTNNGRGCLYLTGGLIQKNRGAVGTSGGPGFTKRYSYDRCAVMNPPPYFPTTGRFMDNRYYELDPVRFNVNQLYKSLTPK